MTIYYLPREFMLFPDPEEADGDGLLAVGGDLSLPRLLEAYANGIFPWYGPGAPILWWSPDPRPVLYPREVHVSRRLQRFMRQHPFEVTLDRDFERVMRFCAMAPRPQGEGTWILEEMVLAYCTLHAAGYAHSVEVWEQGELVGGLYGVAMGRAFFGESMFHRRDNASKVALVVLMRLLALWGYRFLDCQQTTPHMRHFGIRELPRLQFLRELREALRWEERPGSWAGRDPGLTLY